MKTIGDSLPRRFKAKASGSITAGKPLIVEADGDVKQVAETAFSDSILNTGTQFHNDNTDYPAVAYDVASGKIVVAYKTASPSVTGAAVVGTVNLTDGSISFGTPVTFLSGNARYIAAAYDASAERIVIAYSDGNSSNHGKVVVGQVSGTSISFGTAVTLQSAQCTDFSIVYDSKAQKVVIGFYHDGGGGKARVGTVSGTSISLGTAVTFNSGGTYEALCVVYDSTTEQVVIVYQDHGNSNYGTAIVGAVSGTDISFGSEVVFNSATTYLGQNGRCADYDPITQKVLVTYADGGNSNRGTLIALTVSGTSVSAGSELVFESGSLSEHPLAVIYSATAKKFLLAYTDSSTNYGQYQVVSTSSASSGTNITINKAETQIKALVYDDKAGLNGTSVPDLPWIVFVGSTSSVGEAGVIQIASGVTNLTSENYIGIAEYAAADTETATVLIKGGVSTTQSSLTPGQTYFVQGDGTIGTSAGSPSVTAGTAVTSTKLIVKG